jgi:hypothetical protein
MDGRGLFSTASPDFNPSMPLVNSLAAEDLTFQGSFEVALDLTIWPLRHTLFDDLRRKILSRRVTVVAAPETVLWLGRIQLGSARAMRPPPSAKVSAPVIQEPHSVAELLERRIE